MSWLHVPDQQTPFLTAAGMEQERQRSGAAVMAAKQHHNPSNTALMLPIPLLMASSLMNTWILMNWFQAKCRWGVCVSVCVWACVCSCSTLHRKDVHTHLIGNMRGPGVSVYDPYS